MSEPRRGDWLVGQLPVGMLDNDFFYRFASIFQEEATTLLDDVDNLSNVIDPAVAPLPMVRFLAGWLGLPPLAPSLDEAYQRRYVREAAEWRWWRGTKLGLTGLLDLLTGGPVEIADSGGIFRQGDVGDHAARAVIRVASTGWLSEEDFIDLVADEVPANLSTEIFVGERRIWPGAKLNLSAPDPTAPHPTGPDMTSPDLPNPDLPNPDLSTERE